MLLNCLAVTKDATIRQALEGAAALEDWSISILDEPTHLFSPPVDSLHLLVLDDSAVGNTYLSIIKKVRKRFPAMEALVVGGPKSHEILEQERQTGVDHYLARPLERKSLEVTLANRLNIARIKAIAGIVGRSRHTEEVLQTVLLVAPTEVPILIQGESGTGKDVVASAIHHISRRSAGPFEAINCASLAEGVLESELFGHEKGSFTGAVSRRAGIFERANNGTIFLDEVGEMSANMQVRLLRVLESGEVLRVGGVKSFDVDVRVISATNRNLGKSVAEGSFRQDLYYRLKGVSLYLPPLRERSEDISLLVDRFIIDANKQHRKQVKGIEAEGMRRLSSYSWPGNIRELKNLIDTLVVLTHGDKITAGSIEMQLEDSDADRPSLLPVAVHRSKAEAEREMIYASILALHRDIREILHILKHQPTAGPWDSLKEVPFGQPDEKASPRSLSQLERSAIQDALRTSDGNRRRAAEILGISERTLYRKIKEYGLV